MTQYKSEPFVRQYLYYKILAVSRNATQEEIRRAYFKLANELHPDKNPDPVASKWFIKITEAYEVLSNPAHRSDYDNSPAECPMCWTYEVIWTSTVQWRCRRCWCQFGKSKIYEVIPEVERPKVSEKLQRAVELFKTTQCSWCKLFYTQPFLCPYSRLQSNCFSLNRLSDEQRRELLGQDKWWWMMQDMIRQAEERGVLAKCRQCSALNPNPQKPECWQCHGDGLTCPTCSGGLILRYDIEGNFWKCPNAAHSGKPVIGPKISHGLTVSEEICRKCGKNLYLDTESVLWRCKNCKRIYTYHDLKGDQSTGKKAPPEEGAEEEQGSRRDALLFLLLLVVALLVIVLPIVLFGVFHGNK